MKYNLYVKNRHNKICVQENTLNEFQHNEHVVGWVLIGYLSQHVSIKIPLDFSQIPEVPKVSNIWRSIFIYIIKTMHCKESWDSLDK